MKKLMSTLFVIAAVATMALADDKPDFSGAWKMDADKSVFGPMPPPATMTRKIAHKDPGVTVDQATTGGPQGDISTSFKYSTDGKETTNSFMGTEVKSTASWDGKTLVINSKLDVGGNEIKLISKWSLSEDGKTLTDATHFTSPQGEADITYILVKQ